MDEDKQLNAIIDALYEAALEPGRWEQTLAMCAQYAGGSACHMLIIDKRCNQPLFSVTCGETANPESENAYVNHYMYIDPRMTSGMLDTSVLHDWRFCHDYLDNHFVSRNEFFQDFFIPNAGLRYAMGGWLDETADQKALLGIFRAVGQTDFDGTEDVKARHFSGHLQRAIRLQRHTQSLHDKADLGARAINAMALPMLIVNRQGRVLHLNEGAEQLLRSVDNGLSYKYGRLSAVHPADQPQLTALILEATASPAVGGAMWLNGKTHRQRQLLVTPLPAASPFTQDWQTPLALLLAPETGNSMTTLDLLGKLYHLTDAELRLASALLAGNSPEEYAAQAGTTLNTVRTQLKALFRKTDTGKQFELVALLSKLPALR